MVFLLIVLTAAFIILSLSYDFNRTYSQTRSDVLELSRFIGRLVILDLEPMKPVQVGTLISEIIQFQSGHFLTLEPEVHQNSTVLELREALRIWITQINDYSYLRNIRSLLVSGVVLLILAVMTIILMFRMIQEYRTQKDFLYRFNYLMNTLKGAAVFQSESDLPDTNLKEPKWIEEQYISHSIQAVVDDVRLNEDLLESGYNTHNLDELLEQLQRNMSPWIPCGRLAFAFVDSLGNVVAETAISSQKQIFLNAGFFQSIKDTSLESVFTSREPRIINDLKAIVDSRVSLSTQLIVQEGYRSSLTLPLVFNDRCVGFVFINSTEPGAYSKKHIRMAQRFFAIIKTYVYHHYIVQLILAETASAFVKTMEKKDDETSDHIIRMTLYSHCIAESLNNRRRTEGNLPPGYGINQRMVREILWFAPLHDLGKIGIPDEILFKPGSFDTNERNIMETHVTIGSSILSSLNDNLSHYLATKFLDTAVECINSHHERWDGAGYPDGLSGTDIPLAARIIALADVFDALTTKRPYKDPWPLEKAYAYIREQRGLHFDPLIVDEFFKVQKEIETILYKHQNN